jgi:phage terminase large subunit
MDFGFTNDPTTAVAVYKSDGEFYLDELFYMTNLTNSAINSLLLDSGLGKSVEIWADSADPKTIKEIKNYGWRIYGADKGKDSILFGIGVMQEQELFVTRRSGNLINELQNYIWMKDKEGSKTNKPIDAFNHAIDAIRYLFMSKIGKRSNASKTPFYIGR